MVEALLTHINLERDTHYFLYVGEFKACGLSEYLREALSRIHGRKVDFVAIVPDVLKAYKGRNVMVINPIAGRLAREMGRPVNCRISPGLFAAEVSRHPKVLELIAGLLKTQREVEIYLFESLPEFTLDRLPGVRIIGPDKALSRMWNNKVYQRQALEGIVPVADFKVSVGLTDTLSELKQLRAIWKDGIYVSLESGGGGSNSCVILPSHAPAEKMNETFGNLDGPYLISRYIPHECDPTVLAVVANPEDVHVAGVADQHIENLNRFKGSVFPSILPEELIAELEEYTKRIGRRLGQTGYRGIFGCDYLIDAAGNIAFLEVNARKQGTTMEMCCTAENCLPDASPSLPELEYWAVTENRLPGNAVEVKTRAGQIHWGTYNYKLDKDIRTNGSTCRVGDERTMFREIACTVSPRELFCVVENIGSDHIVTADTFLGRVISVATDRSGVERGLNKGRVLLEETIGEVISHA